METFIEYTLLISLGLSLIFIFAQLGEGAGRNIVIFLCSLVAYFLFFNDGILFSYFNEGFELSKHQSHYSYNDLISGLMSGGWITNLIKGVLIGYSVLVTILMISGVMNLFASVRS